MPTNSPVGEAFATRNFSMAGLYLGEDVMWEVDGSETIRGKDAVTAELSDLAEALRKTTVTFRYVQAFANEHAVTVISVADYVKSDGVSPAVASFDSLVFDNKLVYRISSYNMELPAGS